MSIRVSSGDALADIDISNSSRALGSSSAAQHHDASSHIDEAAFARSRHGASQMAGADRKQGDARSAGDGGRPLNEQSASLAGSGRHSSDGLLQVPSDGPIARPPATTAVWDWDTDLDFIGDSNNFYYEPQGELRQAEQREHDQSRDEFSIPHAVAGSGVQWSAQAPEADQDGFIIPQRPSTNPQNLAGNKRKSSAETSGGSKQPDPKRSSRVMSETTEGGSPPSEPASASATRPQVGPSSRLRSQTDTQESRARPDFAGFPGGRPGHGPSGLRRTLTDPSIPMVLPARKVFPIQIGDKLFRLSGASISSDAPSYFSQFFEEQLRQNEGADSVRTLYIDRDPATFEDISLHLQGYHVEPRDGPHFVKLFADAQFFSLPRLTAQLFSSTIYIRIGDEEFQISRDLFSNPGDSPNYFSLGFSIFFTSPTEAFPGLSQRTLLRPPSILPPSVPNRSAKTFADLLHILKGYPVEIRSEQHRAELLRDARYFHLKGLEQRLIPHSISYNLARKRSEMVIRLEDIRQSGISFVADGQMPPSTAPPQGQSPASPASSTTASNTPLGPGWVYYQRPYIDPEAYSLILEIGGSGEESTFLALAPGAPGAPARIGRALFHRATLARITSLFSVIANKMNLPVTQPLGLMMMERGAGVASLPVSPGNTGVSEEKVKVRVGMDADVVVDGRRWSVGGDDDEEEDDDEDDEGEEGEEMDVEPSSAGASRSRKRRRRRGKEDRDEGEDWVVRKAQWRLRVQPVSGGGGQASGKSGMEVILGAVKIEAFSSERGRNAARGFLI